MMDKRLETIQWLKEEQDRLQDDSPNKLLLKIAIEDMKKQIPKPIDEHCGKFNYVVCPTCGRLYWEKAT